MMSMKQMMEEMKRRDPAFDKILRDAMMFNLGIRMYNTSGEFGGGAAYTLYDDSFKNTADYRRAIVNSIAMGAGLGASYLGLLADLALGGYDPYVGTLKKIGSIGPEAILLKEYSLTGTTADALADQILADLAGVSALYASKKPQTQ
jgi:hypothetical protein